VGAHIAKGGGQALQGLQIFRSLQDSVDGTLLCLDAPGIHRTAPDDPRVRIVGNLVMPQGVFDLARALRQARGTYDLVQLLDTYYALPATYLARAHPRVILEVIDPVEELGDRYGIGMRWMAQVGLSALLRDTHVVVNSPSLVDTFRRYHPSIIPNGLDLDRFSHLPDRVVARREFGLPEESPILLLVCKVIPVKRVEWFLEVVRRLPAVRGVVVGGYDEEHYGLAYYRRLRAQYRDVFDRVTFVGEVLFDQVIRYLAAADIFVFPSRFEGMPNVVDEAMAAGLPVVASDIPAHREMITHGETGFLAADVDALTEMTQRLIADASLRRRVGESGARYVRANFSIKQVASKFLALYRRVLDGEEPGAAETSRL
jgi:glycosyltransferase involved in cell wall biosynthesis